jgi:8-oxo-dGTP diphosphatase
MINCTFENGSKTSLRHVTVDAIVVKDGDILLVKRSPAIYEGGMWAIPGGYLARDERIGECAEREVLEETGWEVELGPVFAVITEPHRRHDEERQNVNFTYIVTAIRDTGHHDQESTEMAFFPPDRLPPADQMAFDHGDIIARYIAYASHPYPLPVLL